MHEPFECYIIIIIIVISIQNYLNFYFVGKLSKEEGGVSSSPPSQHPAPSEAPSKQASTEEEPWISSPKDTIFPETIPEESSSTEEEHVVNDDY